MFLKKIGRYVLLEPIAEGGMGHVYIARSQGTAGVSRLFAIKTLRTVTTATPELITMFRDEAKLAVKLNHTTIVSTYEFGIERGEMYLVMDYIPSVSLKAYLRTLKKKSQKIRLDHALYICQQVAQGLSYAHRFEDLATGQLTPVIHRDISPQNILLTYEGEIKLIDFGIAKVGAHDEFSGKHIIVGKVRYMSPEQARGDKVDHRTDIFSLGAVLYECLAGKSIYKHNSPKDNLNELSDLTNRTVSGFGQDLDNDINSILRMALSPNRDNRYKNALDFATDLRYTLLKHNSIYSPELLRESIRQTFSEEIKKSNRRLSHYLNDSQWQDNEKGNNEDTVTVSNPDGTEASQTTSGMREIDIGFESERRASGHVEGFTESRLTQTRQPRTSSHPSEQSHVSIASALQRKTRTKSKSPRTSTKRKKSRRRHPPETTLADDILIGLARTFIVAICLSVILYMGAYSMLSEEGQMAVKEELISIGLQPKLWKKSFSKITDHMKNDLLFGHPYPIHQDSNEELGTDSEERIPAGEPPEEFENQDPPSNNIPIPRERIESTSKPEPEPTQLIPMPMEIEEPLTSD